MRSIGLTLFALGLGTQEASALEREPRVLVIGTDVGGLCEALQIELDPLALEAVARPDALTPADPSRLDVPARFVDLGRVGTAERATGVAEVMLGPDGDAIVLYLSRVQPVTYVRVVDVSHPPGDQDFRSLALVLRSMVQASTESPPPEAEDRPAVTAVRDSERAPAARPARPEEPDVPIFTLGWAVWSRLDGDFSWHGPAASGSWPVFHRTYLQVRGAFSQQATASKPVAQVELMDLLLGVSAWRTLLATSMNRLAFGVGLDLHYLDGIAWAHGHRGNPVERAVLVASPVAAANWDVLLLPPFAFRTSLRWSYATRRASYTIDSRPVVREGTMEASLGASLAWFVD